MTADHSWLLWEIMKRAFQILSLTKFWILNIKERKRSWGQPFRIYQPMVHDHLAPCSSDNKDMKCLVLYVLDQYRLSSRILLFYILVVENKTKPKGNNNKLSELIRKVCPHWNILYTLWECNIYVRGCQGLNFVSQSALNFLNLEWQVVKHNV